MRERHTPAVSRRSVDEIAAEALLAELRIMLHDLRVALAETRVLVDEGKKTSEHALAGVKQIASIESSIIRVFKPIQETVDRHGREIGTLKSRLDKLEIVVNALAEPVEVA
jgi:hypothetical protein